ncbi:MAG: hypothetical protein M3N95_01095 [Actinomycetota bacterium]|nr:hypothetical protein [Actinomycetota bacterium]
MSGARRSLPPLSYTLPSWEPAKVRPVRSRFGWVLGLSMYGLAAWLAANNNGFRRLEVRMMTPVAGFVTGRHGFVARGEFVYFALGTRRAFGLQITAECTSALLLIPLLVMLGSFAAFTPLSLRRQIVALLAGTGLILAVNVLRVAGIAWATWRYGYNPGYTLSHVFVGSAFSLVGFVGAMLLALWVLVRSERMKQAAVTISRAWWAATAPAAHRIAGRARGGLRGRAPAAHMYRRRRSSQVRGNAGRRT